MGETGMMIEVASPAMGKEIEIEIVIVIVAACMAMEKEAETKIGTETGTTIAAAAGKETKTEIGIVIAVASVGTGKDGETIMVMRRPLWMSGFPLERLISPVLQISWRRRTSAKPKRSVMTMPATAKRRAHRRKLAQMELEQGRNQTRRRIRWFWSV